MATRRSITEIVKDVRSDEYADRLGSISTLGSEVLVAAANGDIDLNQVARQSLADSGLNKEGRWVGFENAAVIWKPRS